MAKKKQEIRLESLSGIDFKKEPDIELAQSVIEPVKPEPKPQPKPKSKVTKAPAVRQKREPEPFPVEPPAARMARSTFAPENKIRATFNIDSDLHKALKDYSFFEEVNMVEYIFEHLVKPDLAAKGYYPPRKHKK
jgi:hypothetical protein